MIKAVRVHKVGGPEALVYEAVDVPSPGAGEVSPRRRFVHPHTKAWPGNDRFGIAIDVVNGLTTPVNAHWSWVPTYLNDVMLDWLFEQDRQNRGATPAPNFLLAR